MAVSYISKHPEDFKPFINDDDYPKDSDPVEEYCKRMKKDCVWGG